MAPARRPRQSRAVLVLSLTLPAVVPPMPNAQYDPAEQQQLREAVAAGQLPDCPRCGVKMNRRAIGGGSFGLGYARQREWLLCPKCHRSALFDVKRGTRN